MTQPVLTPDLTTVAQRFCRAHLGYRQHATVQADMATKLIAHLQTIQTHKNIPRLLEIGVGSGFLTDALLSHFSVHQLYLNDLYAGIQANVLPTVVCAEYLIGDIQTLDLPPALDGVISSAVFQWIYPPDTLFAKIFEHLKVGGFLAVGTFVQGNLHEIRALTGQGLCYDTPQVLSERLHRAGFVIDVIETQACVLTFHSPMAVLRHLQATGVTATGSQKAFWTKQRLATFCQEYQQFNTQSGYTLTYQPLLFVAHKPKNSSL